MSNDWILVVDDDCGIREGLQEFLSSAGWQSRVVPDGRAALLEISERGLPRVVIADQNMPQMTGQQLFACMQADPLLADIPFVLMTATQPPRLTAPSIILRKPFDGRRLLHLLDELIHPEEEKGEVRAFETAHPMTT